MAMELHVLSDRPLGSIIDWQRAINAEGFPLQFATNINIAHAGGFLPVQLVNKPTGFECFHDDAKHTMEFLGESNFDRRWRFALGLRWLGSSVDELQAAWMAATAYAAAADGIIFDHEEGKAFTPQQARDTVRNILRDVPAMEALLEEVRKKFAARSGK